MTAVVSLAMLGQVVFGQVADVEAVAAEAGVDPVALLGAVNSTGLEPHAYLAMTGELRPSPAIEPTSPAIERRLDCIKWFESRNVATATNPRSGAAGHFQFLKSTWLSTPQGRAGLSPYDPVAAREAARYMIYAGRVREWSVVQVGLC